MLWLSVSFLMGSFNFSRLNRKRPLPFSRFFSCFRGTLRLEFLMNEFNVFFQCSTKPQEAGVLSSGPGHSLSIFPTTVQFPDPCGGTLPALQLLPLPELLSSRTGQDHSRPNSPNSSFHTSFALWYPHLLSLLCHWETVNIYMIVSKNVFKGKNVLGKKAT